ncbi:NRDE family protein [Ornithinibacillus bavariensis]|uniref:NRDE family protein n=1 Tax=Ornithinibacillus bavariensis TaxID=545502 RepID=A0A919X493_9BACI|nr:NRDE family protein [Ornithinibacillus bavariensis]GIO25577.1 hypothetical protein J43TS3_01880 [Ornithinibacillus bavariensis]
MCLILFQLQDHPSYKLILAANRDEAYDRPTKEASFWEDKPNILAGRDLLQMGTWLGITTEGRFAALTNYRHPDHMKSGKFSRGEITTNYLAGNESSRQYIEKLSQAKGNYLGFNLLVGNADGLVYYNNIEDKITKISPGTHGLSNHFLDTPWPKVEKGRTKLREYVNQTNQVSHEELFQILADSDEAQEELLPDTGIGLELEKKLSPLFIKMPDYGTRCSTVLTIDNSNHVAFTERTYISGVFHNEKKYNFQI